MVQRRSGAGGTQETAISLLDERLRKWYKDTKFRSRLQGVLAVERLRTSKMWPKLKAKAAATRHLSLSP